MRFILICCCYLFFGVLANGQADTLPSYFMEDGKVFLEFDIRDYQDDKAADFSKIFEFAGIDISAIVNDQISWPRNGWSLKKLKNNIYQLQKDLETFDEELSWSVKYKINGTGWTEPTSEIKSQFDSTFISDMSKLSPKLAVISESGNVSFKLKKHKNAKQVILAGSFNNWDEQEIKMLPTDDGWAITLELHQGIYEYKFIADGHWLHDPANSLKIRNEHETWNSILLVGENRSFRLPDHLQAKKVILSGSFNSWNEKVLKMEKKSDGWYLDLPLPPGKHYYKFIVDGKWLIDPENIYQEPDQYNRWNSVLLIH